MVKFFQKLPRIGLLVKEAKKKGLVTLETSHNVVKLRKKLKVKLPFHCSKNSLIMLKTHSPFSKVERCPHSFNKTKLDLRVFSNRYIESR